MPAVVVGKVVARSPSRETTREVLWLSTPTEIGMAATLVVVTDPGPGGSLLDTVSSDPFPVRASRDTTAGAPRRCPRSQGPGWLSVCIPAPRRDGAMPGVAPLAVVLWEAPLASILNIQDVSTEFILAAASRSANERSRRARDDGGKRST